MKKNNGIYLVVVICMCGLIGTSLGLITNIAGLFFSPIAQEFHVLRGSVSMTLTLSNLLSALGGLLMPKLIKDQYLKPSLIFITFGISITSILLGLTNSLPMMYLLHVIRGFLAGLISIVFITIVVNNWFYERVGLAMSVALSFSGISGAIFSPIINHVITNSGYRTGYFVVAIIAIILNLPAICLLPSIEPTYKGYQPYGYKEEESKEVSSNTALKPSNVIFVICCICALIVTGFTSLTQHFPGISQAYGYASTVGAMMLSLTMISNSAAKVLLGHLIDTFGPKRPILLHCVILCLSTLSLLLFHSPMMLYVASFFYGFIYSVANIGLATLTKDSFGKENYSKKYPTVSMIGTVGTALTAAGIGYVYDYTHSYTPILFTILCLFILVTILVGYCYRMIKN